MYEIEPIERMRLVLDAPKHMDAASGASVALNCCRRVDNLKLIAVSRNADLVARNDGDNGELRTGGLPALRAAAGVIMGRLRSYRNGNRTLTAFALERAALEVLGAGLDAAIHRRMDRY